MFDNRTFKIFTAFGFAVLLLAGCRAEEQGRSLDYEPGVYPGGKPTSALTEDALSELRQRALLQGGLPAGGASSGGGETTGANVRPPEN